VSVSERVGVQITAPRPLMDSRVSVKQLRWLKPPQVGFKLGVQRPRLQRDIKGRTNFERTPASQPQSIRDG
jgi:hypothetical protein